MKPLARALGIGSLALLVACGDGESKEAVPVPADSSAPEGTAAVLAGTASGGPALAMRLHTMRDSGMRDMESHTVLAPKGWTVEGGAWWPATQFFSILPSQDITVSSPDGPAVRIGPSFGAVDFQPSAYSQQFGAKRPAEGSADNGYPVVYMPESLADWKRWLEDKILPAEYPDAKKIRVESAAVIPELSDILQRQIEPLRQSQAANSQQWAAMGSGMQSFIDASVLAFEWTYREGGESWEGLLIVGHTWMGSDTELGRQLSWTLEPSVTYRAKKGELEGHLPLLMSIANSVRPTPKWFQMKLDHMRAMNRIAAKGAAERSNLIAESNREINQMIQDGWRERNEVRDAAHEKFINTIRGVDDYTVDGSSDSVQLPSHYGHVFSNGNGEYLLTNDALFDPNTDPAFNSASWDTMRIVE